MLKLSNDNLDAVMSDLTIYLYQSRRAALITKYAEHGTDHSYNKIRKENLDHLKALVSKSYISMYLRHFYHLKPFHGVYQIWQSNPKLKANDIYPYDYYFNWVRKFNIQHNINNALPSYPKSYLIFYRQLLGPYEKMAGANMTLNLNLIANTDTPNDKTTQGINAYQAYLKLEDYMVSPLGRKLFHSHVNCLLMPKRIRFSGDTSQCHMFNTLSLADVANSYHKYMQCIIAYVKKPQVMFNLAYELYRHTNMRYAQAIMSLYSSIFESNEFENTDYYADRVDRVSQDDEHSNQLYWLKRNITAFNNIYDKKSMLYWLVKFKVIKPFTGNKYRNTTFFDISTNAEKVEKLMKQCNQEAFHAYHHYYLIMKKKHLKPIQGHSLAQYPKKPSNSPQLAEKANAMAFTHDRKAYNKLRMELNRSFLGLDPTL